MGCVITNDPFSIAYLGRLVGTSQPVANQWPTNEWSLTWQMYKTSPDSGSSYGSYGVVAPSDVEGFSGGSDYFTAADGDGAGDHHFHLGQDGVDTFHPTMSPARDRWYRQGFTRTKVGAIWVSKFFIDLDAGVSAVIQAPDDADILALTSDARLSFGSTPYINNEGMNVIYRAIKAWNVAKSAATILLESQSGYIETEDGRIGLWGQWPCITAGTDISGNNRPLSGFVPAPGGTVTFDGLPGPPLANKAIGCDDGDSFQIVQPNHLRWV
jgi:hypothetical protein